jgi:hypothetical protein
MQRAEADELATGAPQPRKLAGKLGQVHTRFQFAGEEWPWKGCHHVSISTSSLGLFQEQGELLPKT